ncbi:MAG TPA: GNAT family N-acetyltransferase [Patescibacteria group bacterium]|nr:GNAT family N-acetyltransferase [Patescibacteria group bacterium]
MLREPFSYLPSNESPFTSSLRSATVAEYEVARDAHPEYSTGFNDPNFLKTVARAEGGSFEVFKWNTFESKGILPAIVVRNHKAGTVNNVPIRYIGPIVDDPKTLPTTLKYLGSALATKLIYFNRASFTPALNELDLPQFTEKGFQTYDFTTCVLPLDDLSPEGLPMTTKPDLRRKIRQAKNAGLMVEDATEEDIKVTLPRLMKYAYNRSGEEVPYAAKLPSELWNSMHDKPNVRMVAARMGSETMAVLVALADKDTIYSMWYARSYDNPDLDNFVILESTIGHVAHEAAAAGITKYDLGGGTAGIVNFKQRIGAEVQNFPVINYTHPFGQKVKTLANFANKLSSLNAHIHGRQ